MEVQLDGSAWISLHPSLIPQPGQYLSAWTKDIGLEPLPSSLFPGGLTWLADLPDAHPQAGRAVHFAAPLPAEWGIGKVLQVRGPLGQGFRPPRELQRMALAAFGDSADRLLPLVELYLPSGAAIALFTDAVLPELPLAVEAYPLETLAEFGDWPDYLAADAADHDLERLRVLLFSGEKKVRPGAAQVLVNLPMPCAALGDCGACTVEGRTANFLACKDGPVFELSRLMRW
jgi:hypothetical protein